MITLYDAVMTTLTAAGTIGIVWSSRQLSLAAKRGKLKVVGIVTSPKGTNR